MAIKFIIVAKSSDGETRAFPMRLIDQNVADDGNYDVIIEGDGGAGFANTKLYVRDVNGNTFTAGKMTVLKRQMDVKSSDEAVLPEINLLHTQFNAADQHAILIHDFGVSENPIAIKLSVTTQFQAGEGE